MQQLTFPLVQTVTTEQAHSLICIPDRDTADYELSKLRTEYGPRLLRAKIRIDRPGRSSRPGEPRTYTLRYFTLETTLIPLF